MAFLLGETKSFRSRFLTDLFFFDDLAGESVSRKALMGELLRAKQSGKYKEDACQAFINLLLDSSFTPPRSTIWRLFGVKSNDYCARVLEEFHTLSKDEDSKRLCLDLHSNLIELVKLFLFLRDAARETGSREALIDLCYRAKESKTYKESSCQAFNNWFILSPIVSAGTQDDKVRLLDEFVTLWMDEDSKRLCLDLRSNLNGLRNLFSFLHDVARETGSREALIDLFLRASQSGKYKVDACKAFSDWFILSPIVSARDLQLDEFVALLKVEDSNRLCLDLRSRYEHEKQSSREISMRCLDQLDDEDPLRLNKSIGTAESGFLKAHVDFTEKGLKVEGNEVIPLHNVSSYVLSQVILFLERKQHFQEVVNKAAGHYEGWSTAFFNRNSCILPDLQQAAETLEIPSLLESVNKEIKRKDGRYLNDNLSSEMFHYFSGMAGNNERSRAILKYLNKNNLNEVARKNFIKWFTQIGDSGRDHHNEFKTHMKSTDFSDLCLSLYGSKERQHIAQISLRSNDGMVLKIDKFVAIEESMFLKRCVNRSGFWEEIPLSITSPVLSSVIDFCYKVRDFGKIYGSDQIKEGLVVVDLFRDWTTKFLRRNIHVLSQLHEAADFLLIPSLSLLTTEEVTDLVTRPLDEASVLSGKLSISRMLSSLFVRFTD